MYDFVDRKLTRLDEGGRFLVWSMRLWVTALGLGQCPSPSIAPAFARWHAIGALPPFLRLMTLLNRDALESLHFCSLPCDHVSEHEAIVLALTCATQERRYASVRDTLALLVAEDSIGTVLDALSGLGEALRQADIAPTRPCPTTACSKGETSTE